jgi:hypothetical protein
LGASEQLTECLDSQAGVVNYAAHRQGVDWIMPRNSDDTSFSIGHHNMLSLPNDSKTGSFKRPDGLLMVDTGKLGHGLESDFACFGIR